MTDFWEIASDFNIDCFQSESYIQLEVVWLGVGDGRFVGLKVLQRIM